MATRSSDGMSLPSPTQTRVDIDGLPTNLLCQEFPDKYLIMATQYRKLGTMTLVTEDAALPHGDNVRTHTTQVLLGDDDNITQVVARCLAKTAVAKKPVLVATALKDTSKPMVNMICEALVKLQNSKGEIQSTDPA